MLLYFISELIKTIFDGRQTQCMCVCIYIYTLYYIPGRHRGIYQGEFQTYPAGLKHPLFLTNFSLLRRPSSRKHQTSRNPSLDGNYKGGMIESLQYYDSPNNPTQCRGTRALLTSHVQHLFGLYLIFTPFLYEC